MVVENPVVVDIKGQNEARRSPGFFMF